MNPTETGRRYDALAAVWDQNVLASGYGVAYIRRAMQACAQRRRALDIGCGTGGRLMNELLGAGFTVTGIDVSAGMLEIARKRHPSVELLHEDICVWTPARSYDLVIAWDSTFHVPKEHQASVVTKICNALHAGGVFLFTAGGVDAEITGEMHGQQMYYSSLADREYVRLVGDAGCRCLLLERDQYPLHHLVIIAIKPR
jgi:SAM-dependent methyltransferase